MPPVAAITEPRTELSAPMPGSGRRFALPANVWQGGLLVLLVGTITLAPIGFVISGSFNVSDPGQPARLGLAGWQEVLLRSQATLTAIRYTFLLSLRAPAA